MQIVQVNIPFGDAPPKFYYPATGTLILAKDEECTPSPATLGIWISEVPDEPEFIDESLEPAWSAYVEDEDKFWEDGVVGFFEPIHHDGAVAFEITTSGMA